MKSAAVEEMEARFPDSDVVLIESGGDNLTLTFSPALVDYFIYVIDVAAGDKIPRKNGPGITQSDILVINKTDLAPHVGVSLDVMKRIAPYARQQAVPVHQLQDWRGDSRSRRAHCAGLAVRPGGAAKEVGVMSSVAAPWHAAEALGASAKEFAPFQDEPAQMKSGTVGTTTGFLRLGFEFHGKQTILADLDRRAPYMAQRALYCDDGVPGLAHVFMITTTGCLLQGDRLARSRSNSGRARRRT